MVSLAGRAEGFAWVSLGELLKYHLSSDSPGSLFVGVSLFAVYKQEQPTCWRAASRPCFAMEFVHLVGAWLEAWLCETLPWVPWVFTENLKVHVPAFL